MKNLKTTIITLLLLAATSVVVAQEKWEYAVLYTNTTGTQLVLTTAEKQESFPTKPKDMLQDAIKKVNELSQQGWEVYKDEIDPQVLVAYSLRKKKQ